MRFFLLLFFILNINLSYAEQKKIYWEKFKQKASEYLAPRYEKAKGHFLDHYHPAIQKNYQSYYQRYGQYASENLVRSYDYLYPRYLAKKAETQDFYKKNYPLQFQFFSDIPAFIKIHYEKGIIRIWQQLYNIDPEELLEEVDPSYSSSVNMAMAASSAMAKPQKSPEAIHLNDLLNQIRDHAFDYGMMDCYKVFLIDIDIKNAFNIGCNIFFSKKMYDFLKGDSDLLRAVLAHELAHGDAGHGLKTLASLIKAGTDTAVEIVMEEFLWIAKGGTSKILDELIATNFSMLSLKNFSHTSIKIELEADKRGAIILERAGYSSQALIDFLEIFEKLAKKNEQRVSNGSQRKYPSFRQRIEAIKKINHQNKF